MTKSSNNIIKNITPNKNSGQAELEYALIMALIVIMTIMIAIPLGQTLGNVINKIDIVNKIIVEIPEPTPEVITFQKVNFILVGGTTYPSRTEITMGKINILGIPKEIRVNNDFIVKAVLVYDNPMVIITAQKTPSSGSWEFPSLSAKIEIYPRMFAKLFGSGFDIEPAEEREQRTDVGIPIEWIWTVSPEEPGEEQALVLELSIPVEEKQLIDSNKVQKSIVGVANYPFNVRVLGKTGLTSSQETYLDWIIRLLEVGVVIGAIKSYYWLKSKWDENKRKTKSAEENKNKQRKKESKRLNQTDEDLEADIKIDKSDDKFK